MTQIHKLSASPATSCETSITSLALVQPAQQTLQHCKDFYVNTTLATTTAACSAATVVHTVYALKLGGRYTGITVYHDMVVIPVEFC